MPSEYSPQGSGNNLLKWLGKHKTKRFSVAVLPDFFFDRFVEYPDDFDSFSRKAREVVRRKGGSIDNVRQVSFRGGNAANTAAALASLGATVFPIIETDPLGLALLKHFLEPLNVDLSHVKTGGEASITTALEFQQNGGKVNLMLRDMGSLVNFGPKNLTSVDYELLARTDVVCVFNWAGTRKHGTELAETVFRYVRTKGKGITYYDTADPTPNREEIPTLLRRVLTNDFIDILSLNENEAIQYASFLNSKRASLLRRKHWKTEKLALECAALLSQHLQCRIDLHTSAFSATFHQNKKPVIVNSIRARTLRATGAGDSWNAGNIFADQQGMPSEARLKFANATAAFYVSSREGAHPTLTELKDFIEKSFKE